MYEGKEITIVVPTLKRYDLLKDLVISLESGTMIPDNYFVIDNGGDLDIGSLPNVKGRMKIERFPTGNIGVAASWNLGILKYKDIRITVNDDLTFFPNSLENYVKQFKETSVLCPMMANAFSCFLLPDKVVEVVGLFDETISPKYAYFEDNDYYRRMQFLGVEIELANDVLIEHKRSSTIEKYTEIERSEHHKKFKIAQTNYAKKWGGPPGSERWLTPYNRGY